MEKIRKAMRAPREIVVKVQKRCALDHENGKHYGSRGWEKCDGWEGRP